MTDIAISVRNLGKAYRVGIKDDLPDSLISAAAQLIKSPLKNYQRLRNLNTFTTEDGHAQNDTHWALRDVSFDIHRGDVVGIVGRNGAGKSTLLKILSRITEPTTGHARIRGRVSSLLEVGTGFHPELSGRENIYMNGTILGMTKTEIDSKFDEIVDFSGVDKFLDTPIKRYSSGMKVRLAFAVAAHLEPEILIIDEVLAVGDAEFQAKCLGKMGQFASAGRTVLFVSHNISAVESLCTHGVLLEEGRTDKVEPVHDVIANYMGQLCRNADEDIANRVDREGDGTAKCNKIWLENNDGELVSQIRSGETLSVCLSYELRELQQPFHCRLGVYDQFGTPLIHTSTEIVPIACDSLPPTGILKCNLKKLPLHPGTFYINTSIVKRGGTRADRVERAATFTVESHDFYGSGKLPQASNNKILVKYDWSHEAAPN